jgi:fibronectin-binding autotransporter adhesin
MKARLSVRSLILLVSTFVGFAIVAGPAPAATYYEAVNYGSGEWSDANVWSVSSSTLVYNYTMQSLYDPGDFVVLNGGTIRNTNGTNFNGHSLTVLTGGQIRLKATPVDFGGEAGNANGSIGLILNGGLLDPGNNGTFVVKGALNVAGNSLIDCGAGTGLGARVTDLEMAISGSSTLSLVGTNGSGNPYPASYLEVGNNAGAAASTFSGTWNIQAYGLVTNGTNVLGMSGGTTGTGLSTVVLAASTTLSMGTLNTNTANSQAIAALSSFTPGAGTVNLCANTLTINGGNASTFSGVILGAGGLTVNGAGTMVLAGTNLYTGPTTVSAGVLNLTGTLGGGTGGGTAITVGPGGTLVEGATALIAGSSSLTYNSPNSLTISTSNTFTGGTTISSGTVQLGNASAVGTGNLTANAGTFDLAGFSPTVGALSGKSGTITDSATSPSILTLNQAANTTFGGKLQNGSGTLALTKGGVGSLSLMGTNSYSGATTITGGALQFATPYALYGGNAANWTPANISVASGATFGLYVGGSSDFTLTQASTILSSLAAASSVNGLEPGASFGLNTTNATAAVTYSGVIADAPGSPLGFAKFGTGTLVLSAFNAYSGPTTVANGTLILPGANSGTGTLTATNTTVGGLTVVSIRNSGALGSGAVNSQLSPVSLNATGTALSTTILEIGAKIGTDPGGNNADFAYQVVAPGTTNAVVPSNGQIDLGNLGNSNDGVGFAAYNATSLSSPRIVALYSPGTTTLATLQEKTQFGQGSGDHFTLGSPTANNTLVLLNPIDLNGGANRRWDSIRGTGITPEGEYLGAIVDTAATNLNISFDGNGGLIFANNASSYSVATLQINGGAVFVAASDPATATQTGALGSGTATIQVGTSTAVNPAGGTAVPTTAGANLAFMTYGANSGVGPAATEITGRNISVGGSGVTYASAVLGGMTDDYSAMNGNIALNGNVNNVPTTFTARNGGRVDFGGVISGSGSVVIGNSIVEGDATAPGIALNNNGTIVFYGANTYTGSTAVSAGKLYVNGSLAAASSVSVASGAILGGQGTINGPVSIAVGGVLEAGQAGQGMLVLNGGLSFQGSASINFGAVNAAGNPPLVISGANTLVTNGSAVTINITGAIPGVGNYPLIGYSGIQTSTFALPASLPNRAVGSLVSNGNELLLDVTSLASIVWTGAAGSSWDTTSMNWTQPGVGATQYIDNPGDSVIFDDTAAPNTSVTINGADVHPSSLTFNNNLSTYTISGTNGIAGSTGLKLTGTGTVVLLTGNSFTGPTSIGTGATLQLGNGTLGNDGSISQSSGITNNGALIYNIAGSQVYGGVIAGAGSLAMVGPGNVTLTNSSTYTGGTTITSGTLQLGLGTVGNDGQLKGSVVDNGALNFDYFGNQSFAGPLSGTGLLIKTGAGSVVLSANYANNFTGSLVVSQGTLSVTAPGLGAGGGNVAALSGNGGNLNLGSGVSLTVGSNNASTTFAGIISGSGSITKVGSGNLTLAGASTFGGGTTIDAGTVQLSGANRLSTGGAITVSGGTLDVGGFSQTTSASISLLGGVIQDGTLAGMGVNFNLQSGTVSATLGGTAGLTKTTAGGVVLAASNTYGGNTLISSGTLALANPLALQNSTLDTSGSGTLTFGALTAATFGGLTSGGNIVLNNANNAALALAIGNNNANTTYSGALSGGGSLTKVGNGALTLGGVNTYAGITTVSAGALDAATTAALPNFSTATVAVNGGALAVQVQTPHAPNGWTDANILTLLANSNVSIAPGSSLGFDVVTGDTYTPSFNLAVNAGGTNGLAKLGGGTMILTTDCTFTGPTTIWAGTLQIGSGTANTDGSLASSSIVNNGSLVYNNFSDQTVSAVISGSGSLTTSGPSNLTLTGSNTYAGGTTISGGTLSISADSNLGTAPAAASPAAITINGGVLQLPVGTAYNTATVNTNRGITLGASGGTISVPNAATGAFGAEVAVQYRGVISGSGNLTVTGGAGVNSGANPYLFELGSTNSYTGLTTINNAIVCFNNGFNGGNGPNNILPTTTVLNLINNGWFNFNNAVSNQTIAGLTGDATGVVSVTNATTKVIMSIDPAAGQSYDFPGVMGAQTILTKVGANSQMSLVFNGPGTQILSGANTYTGTTTIRAGTLQMGDGGATGSVAGSVVTDFSALAVNRSDTVNLNSLVATVNGPGGLVQQGPGTLIVTTSALYTGPTTISGGTLQLGDGYSSNGNLQGSAINNNSVLVFANPTAQSYSGVISGSGSVTFSGAGTLLLNGHHTYSGPTVINGTVQLGSAFAPATLSGFGGNGTGYTVNTANLANYTTNAIPITNNVLTLTDGSTLGGEARSTFYNAPISPVNGFTANFTYTPSAGTGTADGVAFVLQSDARGLAAIGGGGGNFGYTGITPSVAIDLNLYNNVNQTAFDSGGTLSAATTIANVNLHSGDPISVSVTYNAPSQLMVWTLTDTVSGASFSTQQTGVNLQGLLGGTSALVGFTGADGGNVATQTISNFNVTYASPTADRNVLPATTALTISTYATLDLNGVNQAVGSINGGGTVTNTNFSTTAALTAGGDNSSQTFAGTISDNSGFVALTKVGTGSMTLIGPDTYSGPTTVNAGVLAAGAQGAFSPNSPFTVNGGTLDATNSAQSISSLTVGSSGALNLYVGNLLTSTGSASLAGTLNVLNFSNGAAELMSYGSETGFFSHVTGVPAGYALSYTPSQLDLIAVISANWVAGSGAWSGGSNWNTGMAPNGISHAAFFSQSTAGPVAIALDVPVTLGTLQFGNGGTTADYTLSGNTLTFNNGGPDATVTTLSGTHTINSPLIISGGNLDIAASNGSLLTVAGNIADDGNARSLTLDGDGSGQLILAGTNTYSGGTNVNSGILIVASASALLEGSNLTVGQGASSFFASASPAVLESAAASVAPAGLVAVPEPRTLVLLLIALAIVVIRYLVTRSPRPASQC